MRGGHLLALAVAVTGCGDTCAERSGTYEAVYTERSGTCGQMATETLIVDEQPTSVPEPCTDGEIRYSDDNCEVTNINVTCPGGGLPGDTMISNGKYTWDESGDVGFGFVTITVQSARGSTRCQSSYDVSISRL